MRIRQGIYRLGFSFGSEFDEFLDQYSGDEINYNDFSVLVKYFGDYAEKVAQKITDDSKGIRFVFDDDYLDKENCIGQCIYSSSKSKHQHHIKTTIIVSTKLELSLALLTFLHELGHALDDVTKNRTQDYHDARESFANSFAYFFVMILYRSNLDFRGYKNSQIYLGTNQALDEYHQDNRYHSFDFFYSDFMALLKAQEIFRCFEKQRPFYFFKFKLKKQHKKEIEIYKSLSSMDEFEKLLYSGRLCDINKNKMIEVQNNMKKIMNYDCFYSDNFGLMKKYK